MYWDRCYDEFAILGRGREYTQPVGVRTQLHPEPAGQMIIVHVPRAPALQYASFLLIRKGRAGGPRSYTLFTPTDWSEPAEFKWIRIIWIRIRI
jgi:hypothetical protein